MDLEMTIFLKLFFGGFLNCGRYASGMFVRQNQGQPITIPKHPVRSGIRYFSNVGEDPGRDYLSIKRSLAMGTDKCEIRMQNETSAS